MKRRYFLPGRYAPRAFGRTGEFRAPKKGEFYLSGAVPQVWEAPNDFLPNMKYHILEEVEGPAPTIVKDGFIYRLDASA